MKPISSYNYKQPVLVVQSGIRGKRTHDFFSWSLVSRGKK